MTIREAMKEKILLFDGGMGSLLQEAGLAAGELPETWNLLHPDVVRGIHRDYLAAGCDVISANTFGANGLKYKPSAAYDLPEIVEAAFQNAKAAVREAGGGYVALDLGPTGKLLKPMGDLAFEDCVALYADVVRLGAANGADMILIETMSDMYELKAAVLAAKENSQLPVFATVVFDLHGKLLTGGTPKAVTAMLEGLGVDALGINCGLGPVQMKPMVEELLTYASVPVIVTPNAGLPRTEGKRTVYDIGPEEFAFSMNELLDMGVSVVGGCCGTTPAHIAEVRKLLEGRKPPVVEPKNHTIVTSYAQAVEIGGDPVLIGERINPTGKPRLKRALAEMDMDYILSLGVEEQNQGAAILDVNVGLPEIDEPSVMVSVVEELQSVVDLPLQIDTTDAAAMERALRIYNGKPVINSVNGKREVMDAVFPLAAKYGGVLVALTLDEDGIPATPEGRLAIARRIYDEAAKYGISRKDILVDCICLTVSSEQDGAIAALETIRRIREEFGGRTILGVSNVSFGLPQRPLVNAAYLPMALSAGLSAAIMNPASQEMMGAFYAYRALAGYDRNCLQYVERYGGDGGNGPGGGSGGTGGSGSTGGPGGSSSSGGSGSAASSSSAASGSAGSADGAGLRRCVEKGLKEQAAKITAELLKSEDSLEIINQYMIPALDRVGRDYEAGRLFLPQLLMSAEAAKAAFSIIKEEMARSGGLAERRGRIILATVKGDIHDIGKNIVRVLLENYSFEVIDLGKDVPPERIVEETVAKNVKLVGLSALMTTTVTSMEETIAQLRKAAPDTKVMVGGAVLTQDYADQIGADAYCRDAMASVNYAQTVLA